MVKRVCPDCNTTWYSADTITPIWECDKCGAKIPKSEERTLDDKDIFKK